jgi:hypothetical protein
VQPLEKFPAFYGTRGFNAAFTKAFHLVTILSKTNPDNQISVTKILNEAFRAVAGISVN